MYFDIVLLYPYWGRRLCFRNEINCKDALSKADTGLAGNSASWLRLVMIFSPWLYNPFDIIGLHRFFRKFATAFGSQHLDVSTWYCKAVLRRALYSCILWGLFNTVYYVQIEFKASIATPYEFLALPYVSKHFQCTQRAVYGLNSPYTLMSQTVHLMGGQQDEGWPGLFWVNCLSPLPKTLSY